MIADRLIAIVAGVAALVLGALLLIQNARLDAARDETAVVQRKLDKTISDNNLALARAATRAAEEIERFRTEEARRTAAMQETVNEANQKAEAYRRQLATADRNADGLRRDFRTAVARLASCGGAAGDPAAAGAGAPAASAADLLADVFGRLESAGRELAAVAQQRGIAGDACVRAHDSLTAASTGQPPPPPSESPP